MGTQGNNKIQLEGNKKDYIFAHWGLSLFNVIPAIREIYIGYKSNNVKVGLGQGLMVSESVGGPGQRLQEHPAW